MKRRGFLGLLMAAPAAAVAAKYLIDIPVAQPPVFKGEIGSFYNVRFVEEPVVKNLAEHAAGYRDYFLWRRLAYGGRVDYGRLKRGPKRDDPILANNPHFQRSIRGC